jgi:DNA-binding SARP family transcriptional activator
MKAPFQLRTPAMTRTLEDQPLPHHLMGPRPQPPGPDWRRVMTGSWQPPTVVEPRLRVRAFGPLRLTLDGAPVPAGRPSDRPALQLLALLVAHGCQPLDAGTVADELGPGHDPQRRPAALQRTVGRLRQLLQVADALQADAGHLALNPQVLWSDVAAFESLTEAAAAGSERAPWQALALYQDALLGTGPVSPRLLARRQHLAQRLCTLATDSAARLRACHAGASAARLLQQALACKPLCEPLYRELMRTQLALGERAEALRTHERCTQLLQAALGVAPSAATEALALDARSRAA